jgi:hypothetical protein
MDDDVDVLGGGGDTGFSVCGMDALECFGRCSRHSAYVEEESSSDEDERVRMRLLRERNALRAQVEQQGSGKQNTPGSDITASLLDNMARQAEQQQQQQQQQAPPSPPFLSPASALRQRSNHHHSHRHGSHRRHEQKQQRDATSPLSATAPLLPLLSTSDPDYTRLLGYVLLFATYLLFVGTMYALIVSKWMPETGNKVLLMHC